MSEKSPIPVYVCVIWNRGLPEQDKVMAAIEGRFRILKQFDVTWPRSHYIKNFAAFYGWKGYSMWFGKRNRSGTGTFRLMIIQDDHPDFQDVEKRGIPEMLRDENVYSTKIELRRTMKRSNAVHASVNEAETRHNIRALFGVELEEFLARPDLDGSVEPLVFTKPLEYRPFPYADDRVKGPRFFEGVFKPNRVDIFLLPRCGVPTIFSCSFRLFGVFGFAFCLGAIKIWMPYRRK